MQQPESSRWRARLDWSSPDSSGNRKSEVLVRQVSGIAVNQDLTRIWMRVGTEPLCFVDLALVDL